MLEARIIMSYVFVGCMGAALLLWLSIALTVPQRSANKHVVPSYVARVLFVAASCILLLLIIARGLA